MHFLELILAIVGLLVNALYATPLMNLPTNASEAGTNSARSYYCGYYYTGESIPGGDMLQLVNNGWQYENVPYNMRIKGIVNKYCGFCTVYTLHDLQGGVIYSGGPNPESQPVAQGRSYFCF